MKFFERLEELQKKTNSLVCPGLDIELEKIPKHILSETDPVFSFNKTIIDATKDLVAIYKYNLAFFEGLGLSGLQDLKKIVDYTHSVDRLALLDGKRNDIGNSSRLYAKGIFEELEGDAITVNPYMGGDSIQPFFDYQDKGVFILTRTSNPGAADFQSLECEGKPLYQKVVEKAIEWDKNKNIGLVTGAPWPEELGIIRKIAPNTTLLIPGVGTQGGETEKTIRNGIRKDGFGAIVISARGIIYASNSEDFAEAARKATIELKDEINKYRNV